MKKIITGLLIIIIISSIIPLLWIDFDSFDIYKFTEEWYKGIWSIVHLIGVTYIVSFLIKENKKNNEEKINKTLIKSQDNNISFILNFINSKDKTNLKKCITNFIENHTTLTYKGIKTYRNVIDFDFIIEEFKFILTEEFNFDRENSKKTIETICDFCNEYLQNVSNP